MLYGETVTHFPSISTRLVQNFHRVAGPLAPPLFYTLASCRFQRGVSGVQEHMLHSVGCRWSGQNQTTVEALFPEHSRYESQVSYKGLPIAEKQRAGLRNTLLVVHFIYNYYSFDIL